MKEYKLSAWPDLPSTFHRTTYRRMLSDMSHRHMTVAQLIAASGASRNDVRQLLQMLAERGLLQERDSGSSSGFGAWLRRTFQREESAGALKP